VLAFRGPYLDTLIYSLTASEERGRLRCPSQFSNLPLILGKIVTDEPTNTHSCPVALSLRTVAGQHSTYHTLVQSCQATAIYSSNLTESLAVAKAKLISKVFDLGRNKNAAKRFQSHCPLLRRPSRRSLWAAQGTARASRPHAAF